MTFSDIRKKIGATTMQARSVLSGTRAGAFKVYASGSGYDFDQLREYQEGDDVRRIDWKSSARSNSLLTREYKDERSRITQVIVDCSGSMAYGSQELLLADVARDVAYALFTIAARTDDDLGLHCAVTTGAATFMPRGGEKYMMQLVRALERDIQSVGQASLKKTIEQFSQRCTRRSLVFLISDFIEPDIDTSIRHLALQHELAIIRVRDLQENAILGMSSAIACQDSEQALVCDTGSFDAGALVRRWRAEQAQAWQKLQVPWFDCYNDGQHLDQLLQFIRRHF